MRRVFESTFTFTHILPAFHDLLSYVFDDLKPGRHREVGGSDRWGHLHVFYRPYLRFRVEYFSLSPSAKNVEAMDLNV